MMIPRSARGVLNSAFRRRRLFIGVFLASLAATTAGCLMLKTNYRSDALLLVKFNGRAGGTDALSGSTISAQATERKEVMNSQAQIMRSRDLLTTLIRQVGVDKLYPKLLADGADPADATDKAVVQLSKDLRAEPAKDANVLEVSLLNADPIVAASALSALVEQFRIRQTEVFLDPQSNFLQEQLERAKQQLSASQSAVESFKTDSGISSLDEERSLLIKIRGDIRSSLAQQQARRDEAASRFRALEGSIRRVPETIQLSDENDRFKSVDDARARLTELRARQTELGNNYREDSVAMRTLQAQIKFAEEDLKARSGESLARVRTGPNPVFQEIQADLTRARAEAAAAAAAVGPLQAELSQVERRLEGLSGKSGRLQELMLQRQMDEEQFKSLMQRSDEARAAAQLQRQNVTSVVVIQQPTIPTEPARPRLLYIAALGVVGGLGLAAVVALVRELMDQTFSLPEQIPGALDVPVLASFGTFRRRPGEGIA